MDFISFILDSILWGIAFTFLFNLVTILINRKTINQEEEKLISKLEDNIRFVNIEETNGIYYWWDRENNNFLAQGSNLEETIENLKKRFPNKVFIYKDQDKQHWCLSGPKWEPVLMKKELIKI